MSGTRDINWKNWWPESMTYSNRGVPLSIAALAFVHDMESINIKGTAEQILIFNSRTSLLAPVCLRDFARASAL